MKIAMHDLHEEARTLLRDLEFIPESGAVCRGEHLRVWFQFRRLGRGRLGKIGVRTAPPVPDLHLRLTQPRTDGGGTNAREAFTDATGAAVLDYVLADLPCSASVLAAAAKRYEDVGNFLARTPDAGTTKSALPLAAETDADLRLAAQTAGTTHESGEPLTPRSWEWSNPSLKITLAEMEPGQVVLAVETEDGKLQGRTVRIHAGSVAVEVRLDPLPEFPGVFGGTAQTPLDPAAAAQAQLTRVEVL